MGCAFRLTGRGAPAIKFNSDSYLFIVDGDESEDWLEKNNVLRVTSIQEIARHGVASTIDYAEAVTPERVPDLIMRYGRVRSDPRKAYRTIA
jgi:hypothetical protein